jgi:hypothetical protein
METMHNIYKHTVLLRNIYLCRIKWHTNCAEIVLALDYSRVKLFLNVFMFQQPYATVLFVTSLQRRLASVLLLQTRSIE